MIASKLGKLLGASVVAVALTVGGVVLAQSGDPAPPGDPSAAPAVAPPPSVGDPAPDDTAQTAQTGQGAARVELSGSAMLSSADQDLSKLREIHSHVIQLQNVALKAKDVIKLNCVNEKLMAIKQLVTIGESARTNIGEAITRSDDAARYDWYSTMTIALEKATALGSDAETCIGEDLSFIGDAENKTEGGGEPDDPTQPMEPSSDDNLIPVASPII